MRFKCDNIHNFYIYKLLYLPANARDTGEVRLVPGLRRSLGGVNANHSSILAGQIPWTEEPGGLQSMVSQSLTQLSN